MPRPMLAPQVAPSDPAGIYNVADRFRRELLARERRAASEMVRAYGQAWKRMKFQLDGLTRQMAAARAAGVEVSPVWLFQQGRLQALQGQVEVEIREFARFAGQRILSEQREAVLASQSHAEQLAMAGLGQPPPGVTVTWARLPAQALEDLVGFQQVGSPLRGLLDELGPEASADVRRTLIEGVATGQNPRKIASRMRAALGGNLVRALTISRTEVMRAYRESSRRTYQANSDVVKGWVWHSAADARTCASCFPAGVVVSGPRPEKVFSRHYTGDVVVIDTAGGKHLTVTPNHPILTPNGWVKAGLLHEGDDVVCRADGERASLGIDVDHYYGPIPIEQVAETLRMVPAEMPCATPDFHGDGKGSEVHVVWSNGLLGNDGNASLSEHRQQGDFGGRGMRESSGGGLLLPLASGLNPLFERNQMRAWVVAEDSLAGIQGYALATKRGGLLKSAADNAIEPQTGSDCGPSHVIRAGEGQLGFSGLIAGTDVQVRQTEPAMAYLAVLVSGDGITLLLTAQEATLAQDGSESFAADAEAGRDLLCRLAGQVSTDRILNVFVRRFSGHVYNLQTQDGWYEANSIIAHNCWAMHGTIHGLDERQDDHPRGRCSQIPITRTWKELGFKNVPETRVKVEEGVNLFDGLSDADREKIIGRAGLRAYQAGVVKLSDFVGRKRSKRWGTMRYARSLRAILGPEEARKWRGLDPLK